MPALQYWSDATVTLSLPINRLDGNMPRGNLDWSNQVPVLSHSNSFLLNVISLRKVSSPNSLPPPFPAESSWALRAPRALDHQTPITLSDNLHKLSWVTKEKKKGYMLYFTSPISSHHLPVRNFNLSCLKTSNMHKQLTVEPSPPRQNSHLLTESYLTKQVISKLTHYLFKITTSKLIGRP